MESRSAPPASTERIRVESVVKKVTGSMSVRSAPHPFQANVFSVADPITEREIVRIDKVQSIVLEPNVKNSHRQSQEVLPPRNQRTRSERRAVSHSRVEVPRIVLSLVT